MKELQAISPIDGRYADKTKGLSEYFSEYALMKKRVFVELSYLIALKKADSSILKIHDDFDIREAKRVKQLEHKTNHDVKAVEYYLWEKVDNDLREYIHIGLTSEDTNNLAYGLLLKEFLKNIYRKKLDSLLEQLHSLSLEHKSLPILARTHGQPASPTTLGKELFVFFIRLEQQSEILKKFRLKGKLNGATGNYSALYEMMPDVDWLDFSKRFVTSLGLETSLYTTQVEPNDTLVELLQCIKRVNNIILDLDQDIWLYIALDYFSLAKKDSEVGSSTMPHKVNPIDFENSEGNLKIANSLMAGLEQLQVSRMQRDLSGSTMMRNLGVAFSHSILAIDSLSNGLSKLIPNEALIKKDLDSHPEVLAELIQTILRKNKEPAAYERLKALTRGKVITLEDLRQFIKGLDLPERDKQRLLTIRPEDYIGMAGQLVK